MSKQIKVGVVGLGYWGPNLVRNFRALPDCDLRVMCDLSETGCNIFQRCIRKSRR